jgi:hypothetical protein
MAIMVVSCSREEHSALPNGYRVWAMNSQEIYVSNERDELIVGFAISQIGVHGDLVAVHCVQVREDINEFQNMGGYSIINSATGEVVRGLDRAGFEKMAMEVGFPLSAMRSVSEFF